MLTLFSVKKGFLKQDPQWARKNDRKEERERVDSTRQTKE